MAIRFRDAARGELQPINAEAPDGAVIGVVGTADSGAATLVRLAAWHELPESGAVESGGPRRWIGCGGELDFSPVATLALEHTLAPLDALVRMDACAAIERLRRAGSSILLHSHEPELLAGCCDEIWWIDEGRLCARGDAREVLDAHTRRLLERIREHGVSRPVTVAPSMRRGDGRAEIVSLETLDAQGRPSAVWVNGETVSVRVRVRFRAEVEDPVVGIMIRTRIGFEVYGTNTELEQLRLGPVGAGEERTIRFSMPCNLCPREYTLTAASHDPDGVWHDWMEDAVAFTVVASRYTAGVADLRASVRVEEPAGAGAKPES